MKKNNYIIISIITIIFILISVAIYVLGNKKDNEEIKITIDNEFYKHLNDVVGEEKIQLYNFKNYTIDKNADITYTLTKEEQEEALEYVGEYIDSIIVEYLNSYNTFNMYNVKINDNFTECIIYTNEKFDIEDLNRGKKIAAFCVYYQYIKGHSLKDIDVKLKFIDKYTNEVVLQTTFKDNINIE